MFLGHLVSLLGTATGCFLYNTVPSLSSLFKCPRCWAFLVCSSSSENKTNCVFLQASFPCPYPVSCACHGVRPRKSSSPLLRQKCYFRDTLQDKPGAVGFYQPTCQLPGNGARVTAATPLILGLLQSSGALISLTWPNFFPLLSGTPMQCFLFCSELWKGTVCLTMDFPFFNSPHPKPTALFLSQRRERKAATIILL